MATPEPRIVEEAVVPVASDADVVTARGLGRSLADGIGFGSTDLTLIATAISEVARNITTYAGNGEICIRVVERAGRAGIVVVARDDGPGIADVAQAMRDGYTSGNGMGLGLPGARRLMDDFEIESEVGKGTTVTMGKWVNRA